MRRISRCRTTGVSSALQGSYPGQFDSGKKLQRGSAAGRYVADFRTYSSGLDGLFAIASADDADGAGLGHGLGQGQRYPYRRAAFRRYPWARSR